MNNLRRAGDELVGCVMGEIFVLPYYKPIIGAGNEIISLTRDQCNVWDKYAIRVETDIKHPDLELVGYLEHKYPSPLSTLLDLGLIRIEGFLPEIPPAEMHGVNVSCRIHIYSNKKDFEMVKSAITRGGFKFLPTEEEEGVGSSTGESSADTTETGVDSSSDLQTGDM